MTELVVVVAIMSILTTVFLFQQRTFDSTTLLRSLAYSVALSIREAQTYGVSVRAFQGTFPAYGIYFDTNNSDRYILFADVNNNGWYDVGSDGLVDEYVFQGNYQISDLCATDGTELCGVEAMAITFKRPNPEACIMTSDPGGNSCDVYSQGKIQIEGPGNAIRNVSVTPSGQISVRALGS